MYYEYFGPRQEFPSIIFWPKHNFITITFPLKKLVQRPFKKSQCSCLVATKSKYDSTNRKCWNVWHGWREMSSFRHVLVTTFFVILNLMADTGIGIRVCNTSSFIKICLLQRFTKRWLISHFRCKCVCRPHSHNECLVLLQ